MFIQKKFIEQIKGAHTGADLHQALAQAILLEHSTIPPYLAAAYSLPKPGNNSIIRDEILAIALEEMLHMAIAANLLIALGGMPDMRPEAVLPAYPGPLPMQVAGGVTVGIEPFSKRLVHDVFMRVEQPEDPLLFPVPEEVLGTEYATIGAFYESIAQIIEELGDAAFVGDPARQVIVDAGFPSEQLFPITDVKLARRAIDWIVSEGEGTKTSPLDGAQELAHYYRFAGIFHGRRLRADAEQDLGYSYSGDALPFDPAQVYGFPANAKAADYAAGSLPRRAVDAFNKSYCDMLRALHVAFTQDPKRIGESIAAMTFVRRTATNVVMRKDDAGRHLPLTFEFVA